jgi:hypothetical protein
MYSHELQTCDWPRNVGCEIADVRQGATAPAREVTPRVPQLSSRVRFSSIGSEPSGPSGPSAPSAPAHIQQIHSLPPPNQQRISPKPVITSRGQPPVFTTQDEILKVSDLDKQQTVKLSSIVLSRSTATLRRGTRHTPAGRGGRVGQTAARLSRTTEHSDTGAARPRRNHSSAECQRHSHDAAKSRLVCIFPDPNIQVSDKTRQLRDKT